MKFCLQIDGFPKAMQYLKKTLATHSERPGAYSSSRISQPLDIVNICRERKHAVYQKIRNYDYGIKFNYSTDVFAYSDTIQSKVLWLHWNYSDIPIRVGTGLLQLICAIGSLKNQLLVCKYLILYSKLTSDTWIAQNEWTCWKYLTEYEKKHVLILS